jgi:ESCRT-II complex subunit VPS36
VAAPDPRLALNQGPYRAESPGPTLMELSLNDDTVDSVKFSFRGGGEKLFHERIQKALLQRKWISSAAPPIPKPANLTGDDALAPRAQKLVGIAGLEMRGQKLRQNNELIIGNAFEDLEALMTSAKEIIAVAESFSTQARESNGISAEANSVLSQSASTLGLATTKDMLGSDSIYISELSRNLAEFLADDTSGILRREGGVITLVDLWAMFNSIRNGVELVSPADFEQAAQMWDRLKLPVRLRRFRSGLLVVQGRDRTDDKTIGSILGWLRELHSEPPATDVPWNWQTFGRGVSAQEAAMRFGWSVGVATEELEMAEEKGALCREQGLDGIRFWENWLVNLPVEQ